MSQSIDQAFVNQYKANVMMLSQQKGSRLRDKVRNESVNAESAYFERLGPATAIKKLSRHSDTPQIDSDHSRRRLTLVDYEWADLIDNEDKVRMLIDPASEYAQAAMWALGRAMDDEIIENALGNAFSGKAGGTTVALVDADKLAAHDGSTTGGVNLNVQTLRAAKQRFDANDVDPSMKRYMAIQSSQLQSLLGETETTSSDFATVKALVQGEINTFMGFEFVRIERLPRAAADITYTVTDGTVGAGTGTITAADSRRCFAWAEEGLLLGVGADMQARISERDDKSYSTQVYVRQSIGATRMEEAKFLEVDCAEV
jgi:hypothetical protein